MLPIVIAIKASLSPEIYAISSWIGIFQACPQSCIHILCKWVIFLKFFFCSNSYFSVILALAFFAYHAFRSFWIAWTFVFLVNFVLHSALNRNPNSQQIRQISLRPYSNQSTLFFLWSPNLHFIFHQLVFQELSQDVSRIQRDIGSLFYFSSKPNEVNIGVVLWSNQSFVDRHSVLLFYSNVGRLFCTPAPPKFTKKLAVDSFFNFGSWSKQK